jgi:hypothetical protein
MAEQRETEAEETDEGEAGLDELDAVADLEELDAEDLDDPLDDAVELEVLTDDDDEILLEGATVVEEVGVVRAPSPAVDTDADVDEGLADDDEEGLDDDEVEASLDVILKERLVVEDEDEEAEEGAEVEDRTGEGATRVLPRQPGEFVCQSCFLLKNETQLADPKRLLCLDCV